MDGEHLTKPGGIVTIPIEYIETTIGLAASQVMLSLSIVAGMLAFWRQGDRFINASGGYCSNANGCNGRGVVNDPLSDWQSGFVAYIAHRLGHSRRYRATRYLDQ